LIKTPFCAERFDLASDWLNDLPIGSFPDPEAHEARQRVDFRNDFHETAIREADRPDDRLVQRPSHEFDRKHEI